MSNNILKSTLLLLLLTLIISAGILSCMLNNEATEEKPGFGIYLVDTGECVISGNHIEAYYRNVDFSMGGMETHAIQLNKAGIEKWDSYIPPISPKAKDTLYKKDFTLKIGEKEIYSGKFYSGISSSSYEGIVILDAVMRLDEEHNRIYISTSYGPVLNPPEEDLLNSTELMDYLEKHGLLR